MKTHILKCTWSWVWNANDERYYKLNQSIKLIPRYVNVSEIKTIDPIIDSHDGGTIGSNIFYMGGVNLIKDDRHPDELMQLINNL